MLNHSPRIQGTLGDQSEALQGSPLIWDMLFGWQGALFTVLLFQSWHHTGDESFYSWGKEKKIRIFTHVSALWYEYQQPLHRTT